MEALYQAIGAMLKDGAEFEREYALVVAAGSEPAKPGFSFACNAQHALMTHQRNQNFLLYWKNAAESVNQRAQKLPGTKLYRDYGKL